MRISAPIYHTKGTFFQKSAPQKTEIRPQGRFHESTRELYKGLKYDLIKIGTGFTKVRDNIEFKEADTIDEARTFAKEQLGVKKTYELNDLDSANYLNEALSSFYNSREDKHVVINGILPVESKQLGAGIHPLYPVMYFNEELFNNIDETIDSTFRECGVENDNLYYQGRMFIMSQGQKELVENYLADPSSLLPKEKANLSVFLRDVKFSSLLPSDFLYLNIYHNGGREFMQKVSGKDIDVTTFCLFPEEVKQTVLTLLNKNNLGVKINDSGPFGMINHELGHKLHQNKVGYKVFDEANFRYTKKQRKNNNEESAYSAAMSEFAKKEPNWIYTLLVSGYAATSAGEFVAETFANLMNGNSFPEEVMDLYRKYNGPEV